MFKAGFDKIAFNVNMAAAAGKKALTNAAKNGVLRNAAGGAVGGAAMGALSKDENGNSGGLGGALKGALIGGSAAGLGTAAMRAGKVGLKASKMPNTVSILKPKVADSAFKNV